MTSIFFNQHQRKVLSPLKEGGGFGGKEPIGKANLTLKGALESQADRRDARAVRIGEIKAEFANISRTLRGQALTLSGFQMSFETSFTGKVGELAQRGAQAYADIEHTVKGMKHTPETLPGSVGSFLKTAREFLVLERGYFEELERTTTGLKNAAGSINNHESDLIKTMEVEKTKDTAKMEKRLGDLEREFESLKEKKPQPRESFRHSDKIIEKTKKKKKTAIDANEVVRAGLKDMAEMVTAYERAHFDYIDKLTKIDAEIKQLRIRLSVQRFAELSVCPEESERLRAVKGRANFQTEQEALRSAISEASGAIAKAERLIAWLEGKEGKHLSGDRLTEAAGQISKISDALTKVKAGFLGAQKEVDLNLRAVEARIVENEKHADNAQTCESKAAVEIRDALRSGVFEKLG